MNLRHRILAGLLVALVTFAPVRAQDVPIAVDGPDLDLDPGVPTGPPGIPNGRKRGMTAANVIAGEMMRDWLAFTSPQELAILESAQATEVTVVRGSMDHLQEVLDAAHIPHVLITGGELRTDGDVSHRIIMVNCPGFELQATENQLPEYVRRGGWLMTTDWALLLLERQFSGYVKAARRDSNMVVTGDEVVPVELYDPMHPLLKGVMGADSAARWWLEGSSYPISIEKPDQVRVLLHSPEMKQRYGHEGVAVHFEYGLGTVFHLTSHMYLQRADHAGAAMSAAQYIQTSLAGKEISPEAAQRAIAKVGGISRGELEAAYTITKFVARIIIENRSRE